MSEDKSVLTRTGWVGWKNSKRSYDAITAKSENVMCVFLFL